jgi:glutamine phosphoribosylpyrophosphate amidotransferase
LLHCKVDCKFARNKKNGGCAESYFLLFEVVYLARRDLVMDPTKEQQQIMQSSEKVGEKLWQ